MDATTGAPLTGIAHQRQLLRDLVTTPIGTRVMHRDYGCGVWELLDAPITASTHVAMASAVAEAVARWLPLIRLARVTAEATTDGEVTLLIRGVHVPTNADITEAILL